MAIFKCKMCGGALEINNETVAVCQYCGTKQTLPKLDDDRKANLYDRANHFRRNNEFDKAMGIYEQILNDDNTDAETYWSLVLCRYGIEYVEDPSSHKRIPTVNRAQFTSIFDDEDYKSALQYADGYQKVIYEQEATAINDIQKGILAISSQEEPFDVFICYKESDNSGRRTPDSVLATELYHELTREGYKVFFSRITLEDKLGTAYEPYIFAALNSAKVMVVLGTKPEFFNAVWVKNEWSRYLALIKNGARKMLIPAYKDMDPYDLPEEFSHLQAQDMSKLGFMQDLVRGIKKIVEADNTKQTIRETIIANDNAGGNVNALLKRGFMALEDGEWAKADDFFEQCLNQNAELSEAYLGKLMAELQVKTQDGLKDCANPFNDRNNYQKAVRFADGKLKAFLADVIDFINDCNKNSALDEVYNRAKNLMNLGQESSYIEAKNYFESIAGHRDSDALAKECEEKAEIVRKDNLYNKACDVFDDSHKWVGKPSGIKAYEDAMAIFLSLDGWKNSAIKADECSRKIAELQQLEEQRKAEETAKAEKLRLERERQAELERIEQEKKKKRNKKIAIISTPIVCAVIAFVIVLNTVIIPNNKYADAVSLLNSGKYEDAISIFETIDEYKDSHAQIEICKNAILKEKYDGATLLLEAGDYEKAYSILESLGEYGDASNKIAESKYSRAMDFYERGEYAAALIIYKQLPSDYKDVKAMIDKSTINQKLATVSKATIGSVVKYGTYTQTAKGEETEIEWYVIDKKDGKALLFSKYILDREPFYKSEPTTPGWEISYIRDWLNSTFYTSAFDTYEQKCIVKSKLTNINYAYGYGMSNDTYDNVFLLSVKEANDMLISRNILTAESTPYVKKYNDSALYYLRTIGNCDESTYHTRGYVAVVGNEIVESGLSGYPMDSSYNAKFGIRPAIWVDLSQINN